MLEGLTRAPHAVHVQLSECVRSLVYSDYPEQWPQLLPQVVAGLSSQVRACLEGAPALGRGHLRPAAAVVGSAHLRPAPSNPSPIRPPARLSPPQDQQRIRGALVALRFLARKFEFRDEEERGPLEGVVAATFPLLLQIFQVGAAGAVGAAVVQARVQEAERTS